MPKRLRTRADGYEWVDAEDEELLAELRWTGFEPNYVRGDDL